MQCSDMGGYRKCRRGGGGDWQHFSKKSYTCFTEDITIIDDVMKIHLREKNTSWFDVIEKQQRDMMKCFMLGMSL